MKCENCKHKTKGTCKTNEIIEEGMKITKRGKLFCSYVSIEYNDLNNNKT